MKVKRGWRSKRQYQKKCVICGMQFFVPYRGAMKSRYSYCRLCCDKVDASEGKVKQQMNQYGVALEDIPEVEADFYGDDDFDTDL